MPRGFDLCDRPGDELLERAVVRLAGDVAHRLPSCLVDPELRPEPRIGRERPEGLDGIGRDVDQRARPALAGPERVDEGQDGVAGEEIPRLAGDHVVVDLEVGSKKVDAPPRPESKLLKLFPAHGLETPSAVPRSSSAVKCALLLPSEKSHNPAEQPCSLFNPSRKILAISHKSPARHNSCENRHANGFPVSPKSEIVDGSPKIVAIRNEM